mgnify:FL=1
MLMCSEFLVMAMGSSSFKTRRNVHNRWVGREVSLYERHLVHTLILDLNCQDRNGELLNLSVTTAASYAWMQN